MQDIKTLCDSNCEGFCKYLKEVCDIPYAVSKEMLNHFMPMRINAFNMFRLSLAIMHYLPEVDTRDITLAKLQEDLPNMWAHIRVTDVDVRETSPGRFYAYVEVLFMNTILAGRLMSFRIPCLHMRGIFKSLGLRNRVKESDVLNPRELVGMYATAHIVETETKHLTVGAWTVNDSERKKNKELSLLRKKKACSFVDTLCVDCAMGKDKCALACRKKTIGGVVNDQTTGSGTISTSGKQAPPAISTSEDGNRQP